MDRKILLVMAMIMGSGLAGDIAAGELERRLAVIRFRANLVKEGQAEIVADHLRTESVNQRKRSEEGEGRKR